MPLILSHLAELGWIASKEEENLLCYYPIAIPLLFLLFAWSYSSLIWDLSLTNACLKLILDLNQVHLAAISFLSFSPFCATYAHMLIDKTVPKSNLDVIQHVIVSVVFCAGIYGCAHAWPACTSVHYQRKKN